MQCYGFFRQSGGQVTLSFPRDIQDLEEEEHPAQPALAHAATPLGMGHGKTRFASPNGSFKLLYNAKDLPTSIAEAIVRDRFEGVMAREMVDADVTDWGACAVDANAPLRVPPAPISIGPPILMGSSVFPGCADASVWRSMSRRLRAI